MRRLAAIALVLPALLGTAAQAQADSPDPRLEGIESWAFAIGTGTLDGDIAERYAGYDLVVADGEEIRRRHLRALREQGTVVLGYLSVGTIETYRPWYRRLKPYRLEAWKDWKGEFFANVHRRGFRRQISRRIAPNLLAKGLDGLFLDNVDMIEAHRRQARGMRKLVAALGRRADAAGGYLFAQNGFDVIGPSLRHLDGWNREDVSTAYDFESKRYRPRSRRQTSRAQDELREIAARGLLVTATDYTARKAGPVVADAIVNACEAGALPYVSDIDLERIPRPPPGCN